MSHRGHSEPRLGTQGRERVVVIQNALMTLQFTRTPARTSFNACLIRTAMIVSALAPLAVLHTAFAAEPLRYNRDIRPILSDNCFACHGPDKANQKAGLRLDVREVAIAPAKSGDIAIVPGKVSESALVARILTDDADGTSTRRCRRASRASATTPTSPPRRSSRI